MAIIIASYCGQDNWDTDKLGFDFSKVKDYYAKDEILYVEFINGEHLEYMPTSSDFDIECPDQVYVN